MSPDNPSIPRAPIETLCILAPGLLGSSVAKAAQLNRTAKRIHIWSRKPSTRQEIATQKWCDQVFDTPAEAAQKADLVVICSPVDFILPLYEEIKKTLKPGAIVTDVGSTKSHICRSATTDKNQNHHFIGSHPMAGSEKTGSENGDANLFKNNPCIITPLPETNKDALAALITFWENVGAITSILTPEHHDEIVAHVSHLPHLLASSLCNFLSQKEPSFAALSSSGLRDTTRVAAGDPTMWKAIIQTNREEILRAVSSYQDELQQLHTALANRDDMGTIKLLQNGKRFRDNLSH